MRFFGWFLDQESNVECPPDRIWMTERAKYAGIAREIVRVRTQDFRRPEIVLLAHFPEVVGRLEMEMSAAGQDLSVVRPVLAKGWKAPNRDDQGEGPGLWIIVAERHPIRSHDEEIVEAASRGSNRSRVVFHLSLEDALMRRFSGEWVSPLLRRMGMKEDEEIESRMVARKVKEAQRKIEARSLGDQAAESAETWFQWNCPE